MPINFTQIFQDSWNFMRNQKQTIFVFVVALFTLMTIGQAVSDYLMPFVQEDIKKLPVNPDIPKELHMAFGIMTDHRIITLSIIESIINCFIFSWAILSLHYISQAKNFNLILTASHTLRYFVGIFTLNILIILPLVYGFIIAMQSSVGFLLLIIGIYLYVRLCLSPFVYLLEQKPFLQAIQLTWQRGHSRMSTLLIYCLLTDVALRIFASSILITQNLILQLVTSFIIACIYIFGCIFSYRFYQLFIQKA